MTAEEKQLFVSNLEQSLSKGEVIMSEWTTHISQEATERFAAGY